LKTPLFESLPSLTPRATGREAYFQSGRKRQTAKKFVVAILTFFACLRFPGGVGGGKMTRKMFGNNAKQLEAKAKDMLNHLIYR
jgi:hypothetical protein